VVGTAPDRIPSHDDDFMIGFLLMNKKSLETETEWGN
jgi:hypothetical protein